jgi:hypothetical protein
MPLTKIQSLGITDGTIVNADINASAAIASTKLSGITSEVKAWVNFNGTGTPAIRGSLNVSSITDGGTGIFTINYTNALADTNYVVVSLNRSPGVTSGFATQVETYATGSVGIITLNSSTANYDPVQVHLAMIR